MAPSKINALNDVDTLVAAICDGAWTLIHATLVGDRQVMGSRKPDNISRSLPPRSMG